MAKAQEKDPQSELIERLNQAKSKIEAVRLIRQHLIETSGTGAEPKGGEVYNLFKSTKHAKKDETGDRQFVSSTLSQIRKNERLKQQVEGYVPNKSDEPNMSEIKLVMAAAQELDSHNGLEQLEEHINIVLPLLSQLGGNPNKLRKTLNFLIELSNR